jgi:hypothetical protein
VGLCGAKIEGAEHEPGPRCFVLSFSLFSRAEREAELIAGFPFKARLNGELASHRGGPLFLEGSD